MPEKLETIGQYFDKGCDTCPFWEECFDYQQAFGDGECFRDDWAKSLIDYLKDSREIFISGTKLVSPEKFTARAGFEGERLTSELKKLFPEYFIQLEAQNGKND